LRDRDTRDLVCIVVHGTFARDAAWTRENSSIRRAIATSAKGRVAFETCSWSGLNTHAERIRGGRAFAELVAQIRGRPNPTRIVAIAHSHGGNVVAYGSKGVPPADQVDAVVTLGTPFLDLKARRLEPYFRILDICLHGLAIAALILPLLMISHFLFKTPLPPLPSVLTELIAQVPTSVVRWLIALPLFLVVGVSFGFIMMSATWIVFIGRPLIELAVDLLMPKMVARQRDVMSRLVLPGLAAPRVLTVSVRFDEAGWLLRTLDAIAQVPFMVLVLFGLPAALSVLAFVVVYGVFDSAIGLYFFVRMPEAFGEFMVRAGSYSAAVLLASTALFLLFQIVVVGVPQVRKIGFFGESFADYALVRIATSVAPPNTDAACVARYARVRAEPENVRRFGWPRLRHSTIHSDPDVIADVAEWIVNGLTPRWAANVTIASRAGAATR